MPRIYCGLIIAVNIIITMPLCVASQYKILYDSPPLFRNEIYDDESYKILFYKATHKGMVIIILTEIIGPQ